MFKTAAYSSWMAYGSQLVFGNYYFSREKIEEKLKIRMNINMPIQLFKMFAVFRIPIFTEALLLDISDDPLGKRLLPCITVTDVVISGKYV